MTSSHPLFVCCARNPEVATVAPVAPNGEVATVLQWLLWLLDPSL